MISIGMGQLQQACLSGFSSPFILKTNASWVRRRLDHWLSQTLPLHISPRPYMKQSLPIVLVIQKWQPVGVEVCCSNGSKD